MNEQRGSQPKLTVAHEIDHGHCCWQRRCRCGVLLLLKLLRGNICSVRLVGSALSKLTVVTSTNLAVLRCH